MLQCCVHCLSVVIYLWRYALWLNDASWSKSYYWQSIGSRIWKIDWNQMNDHDHCLEVVWALRSYQSLHHIRHWISQKPSEIETWFQRITNRKWPMGPSIKWSRDRWRYVTRKVKLVTPICLDRNISKTAKDVI